MQLCLAPAEEEEEEGGKGARRGSLASDDGVFLFWLWPSRDRGVWWNVDRMLSGCGGEED